MNREETGRMAAHVLISLLSSLPEKSDVGSAAYCLRYTPPLSTTVSVPSKR